MPKVVGVRFRTSPRMYWFAPTGDEEQYKKGASVIVETQRGVEIATVIMPPKDVDESQIVQPLKSVTRLATESDLAASRADADQKQSIIATAKQKVSERGLDMKIVDCEFTVDHSKLVLYFTAEQRVDFRELVRDLASAFHMRIDLRQISARDECKLIGSLGPCGKQCCCGDFESDSEHVSIKMAKNQNLALTPGKINGMCGRLLCCLAYENRTYEDVLKRAPKHGALVTAPDGRRGTVVTVTPLTETVRVRFGDDENFEFCDFPLDELTYERRTEPQTDQQKNNNGKGGKPNKNKNNNDGENRSNDRRDKHNNNNNNNNGNSNAGNNGGNGGNNNNNNGKPGGGKNKRRGGKNRNKNRNGAGPEQAPTE